MKKTVKKPPKKNSGSTLDAMEIRQFDDMAAHWWDESGPLKPLHKMGSVRMDYIKAQLCGHFGRDDFSGLQIIDVGCGGGLVAEPLKRLGADVTGIDAGGENIKAARKHSARSKLDIDYRVSSAEEMAKEKKRFDAVIALEIIEHVADPKFFIASCCKLVKKGGMIILSTLNRTPKSYLLGIVAAEQVLKWVPEGTHDWEKFVKPSELKKMLEHEGFMAADVCGMIFNPLTDKFSLSREDVAVNYFMTASTRSRK